jgi:uncharacterized protein YndB with AHSA1/START domain
MTEQQPPDETDGKTRAIELEVTVPGAPEEVWTAIATGPGRAAFKGQVLRHDLAGRLSSAPTRVRPQSGRISSKRSRVVA